MVALRQSPSGPPVPGGLDSTSDGIENDSLVPDAATLTEALNRLVTSYTADFNDDFASGRNASVGSVPTQEGYGECQWTVYSGGSFTPINRPAAGVITPPVIGAYNLNLSGTVTAVALGGLPAGGGVGIDLRRIDALRWRVFSNSSAAAGGSTTAGLAATLTTSGNIFGNNAFYFSRQHSFSPTPWLCTSRRNSVATVLTSAPFPTVTTYHMLEFVRAPSGNLTVSIDGVVIGTFLSSQLPVGPLSPAVMLLGGGNCAFDIYSMRYTRRPLP